MTVKTYARRDSATSVLRKLNIKPRDYDLFIKQVPHTLAGGQPSYSLDLEAAKAHHGALQDQSKIKRIETIQGLATAEKSPVIGSLVETLAQVSDLADRTAEEAAAAAKLKKSVNKLTRSVIEKAKSTSTKAPKASKPTEPKESISSVMRQLIIDGKTNQEVWDACKTRFALDDKKRGYPAWYRTELKNKGQLPEGSPAR